MKLKNDLGKIVTAQDVLKCYYIDKTNQKSALDALARSRLTNGQKEEACRFASKQSDPRIS